MSAPWRIDPWCHGSATVVKSADAPRATDIADFVRRGQLDHAVADFSNSDFAAFVVAAQNSIDRIQMGDFDGPLWDTLRAALEPLSGIIATEVGSLETDHAGGPIVAIWGPRRSAKGGQTMIRLGHVVAGNGDIGLIRANAAHIAALLGTVRAAVSDARKKTIAVRGIGRELVVIDAADAKWFDTHNWEEKTFPPHPSLGEPAFNTIEIIERGSDHRLGDLLAGSDGIWARTNPGHLTLDGSRYLDFRRHRLGTADATLPVSGVRLPPEVLAVLTARAKAHGGDLGRAIASLLPSEAV